MDMDTLKPIVKLKMEDVRSVIRDALQDDLYSRKIAEFLASVDWTGESKGANDVAGNRNENNKKNANKNDIHGKPPRGCTVTPLAMHPCLFRAAPGGIWPCVCGTRK